MTRPPDDRGAEVPAPSHLLLKFKSRDTSAAVEKLATILGVEVQYIELDKSRGGAPVEVCGKKITQQHDNGLAYLTHVKYPDKFQYPPEQVASVRGHGLCGCIANVTRYG